MNYSSLEELINVIEFGTKIHVCVVFLDNYGNEKTILSAKHCIHPMPICILSKSTEQGYSRCVKCRETVIKHIKRYKKPIFGECVNGIYEYCHPVVINDETVCVVFIGNIYPENDARLLSEVKNSDLFETMEKNIKTQQCKSIANIIDGHIRVLLKEYTSSRKNEYNPLIENVKNYIEENLTFDFSVVGLSEIFNYNEKYLGRLFKSKTGMSIKMYINLRRVEMAEKLLRNTDLPITDISLKVGFNFVTYFNKIFKLLEGVTPQEYRALPK